jgi:hypothetical protein
MERKSVLDTALLLQGQIFSIRSIYPDIVAFLRQNPNALENMFLVWKNQVTVHLNVYGRMVETHFIPTIHDMFIVFMVAVIHPDFLDESLEDFIRISGDLSQPMKYLSNHSEILKESCKSELGFIFYSGDIRQILEHMTKACTSSKTEVFNFRYSLSFWSMFFGQIEYAEPGQFQRLSVDLKSSEPIFPVFKDLLKVFFENFQNSFEVSFRPVGNIKWFKAYTSVFTVSISNTISHAVPNFAQNVDGKNAHAYLKKENEFYRDSNPHRSMGDPNWASYHSLLFPAWTRWILKCFMEDFWITHRKPDPRMTEVDYLFWIFSISEYAKFGESPLRMIAALMDGKELPRCIDGPSFDYSHLSRPTKPAPPNDISEYREYFGQYGPNKISDYEQKVPQ